TGPGIPDDQREKIFSEFYRGSDPQHDRRGLGGGLGLGLAIVDRLCRLLHHPIEFSSVVGRGSRFSVIVPIVAARPEAAAPPALAVSALNLAAEKLIVVIDDDALALDGMGGLLRSWGGRVIAARSAAETLTDLADGERPPDLVISDFHLSDQRTGIEAIEQLRAAFGALIPGFLVSGDISPVLLREAQRNGYHLLHKPVDPIPLRTMLNRLFNTRAVVDGSGGILSMTFSVYLATVLHSQDQSIPPWHPRRTGKALLERDFRPLGRAFEIASAIPSADLPYAFVPPRCERPPRRCQQRLKHPTLP